MHNVHQVKNARRQRQNQLFFFQDYKKKNVKRNNDKDKISNFEEMGKIINTMFSECI